MVARFRIATSGDVHVLNRPAGFDDEREYSGCRRAAWRSTKFSGIAALSACFAKCAEKICGFAQRQRRKLPFEPFAYFLFHGD